MTITSPRRLSPFLVLILFCAQLILAWHSPSHIAAGKGAHSKVLISAADCPLCAHAHGMVGVPNQAITPVPPAHPCLGESRQARQSLQRFHLSPPARGPPLLT